MDNWEFSTASIPTVSKHALVLLNTHNGSVRDTETLLSLLIHEFCHLTERGYYKGSRTPKDVHMRMYNLAKKLTKEILVKE